MKVLVSIVLYHSRNDIAECLLSLQQQTVPHDVLTIDNTPFDGASDLIEKTFLYVRVLRNKKNEGFAAAQNRAFAYAMQRGYDGVFLLNPDMVADARCLERLVSEAKQYPNAGAVQALLLLYHDRSKIQTAGNRLHFSGIGYSGGYGKERIHAMECAEGMFYPSGGAVLYTRTMLIRVGFFDPELFAYPEDLDMGWRMRLSGFQPTVCTDAVIYHKYVFARNAPQFYLSERSRLALLYRNYKHGTLLLLFPFLCGLEIGMVIHSIKHGWFWEKCRAYRYLFRQFARTSRLRRVVQARRTVSDRVILRSMTGEVAFAPTQTRFQTYALQPFSRVYFFFVRMIVRW